MRAVLCKEHGPPESLVVDEAPSAAVGENEVRIGIHACGVNFPDTLIIQGKYQIQPDLPFSPGSEVAGEVLEVGSGVQHLNVGDPVMSLTGWGGFAEEVVIGADRVLPMPASMDYVTAAGFPMVYGTSYHALKQRASLAAGETLLVLGASGGVGLAAVELGKAMGARVIAAASSADKLEVAREHGADELVNYAEGSLKDQVKALTDGKGADVIYDPVGGEACEQALRCINWNGRLLIIGFASGTIPKIPANLPLLKGSSVVGVFWGDFVRRQPQDNARNFQELFALHGEGRLKPHVWKTYPLERAGEALNALLSRQATGKIVLTTGRS
ncbi:NADPH:quinone oxidoreductase family protein [Aquisalimonas lutea]|uniref:NADPH:quinone oxidoreductase family protein n=1 Tax=Aquisalimonas lutea TaxID=1327750 RepID=UPI0025B2F48E|nr:NADPH:quinone oxidoreductase family protein [Aquisalimonas lutea]MDN3519669.1 NADPH:quinone oxidoreductase family protein [Aquisalimonas lutea]